MPTGLIRRGARYSIRRRVPLDLVAYYGKAEITQALGTADPKTARQRLPLKWAALDKEFDALRKRLSAAPPKPASEPPPQPKLKSKAPDRYATMSEAEWDYMLENERFWREQEAKEEFERDEAEDIERRLLAMAEGPDDGLTLEQRAIRNLLRDKDYYRKVAEDHARWGARAGAGGSSVSQSQGSLRELAHRFQFVQ